MTAIKQLPKQELTFSTSTEHETILLHGLCEKVCAIGEAGLHKHLRSLEFVFAEMNKTNPHLTDQNLRLFAFISECFLTGSQYYQFAQDIYAKLDKEVKSL